MNHLQGAAAPAKRYPFQILTGYGLKMLGLVFMVLDHIHQMFSPFGAPLWLTMLGRVVLPIFLFMASEGFCHTRSRPKYAFRLLIGFWGMGLGNLLLSQAFPLQDVALVNNVFGTVLVSVFYMWMVDLALQSLRQKNILKFFLSLLGFLAPIFSSVLLLLILQAGAPLWVMQLVMVLMPGLLTVEGGYAAVVLAVAFYLLRKNRWLQLIPLVLVSILSALGGGIQWLMVFAAIPILLYNGAAGRKSKYFFYIFYPAHIYLLYLVSYFLH
ncbi:MAG: TraX family protein [Oscillospiraceae bacterium]